MSLLSAARTGNRDLVAKLLKRSPQAVADRDEFGQTALHIAAKHGHLSVIRYLAKKFSDLHGKDRDNNTALHTAAEYGQIEAVRLLVQSGLRPEAVNGNGDTVVHVLVRQLFTEDLRDLLVWILKKNSNSVTLCNLMNSREQSPLHLACCVGDAQMVSLLLHHGSQVVSKDKNNQSPWSYAQQRPNKEALLRVFAKYGYLPAPVEPSTSSVHTASASNIVDAPLMVDEAQRQVANQRRQRKLAHLLGIDGPVLESDVGSLADASTSVSRGRDIPVSLSAEEGATDSSLTSTSSSPMTVNGSPGLSSYDQCGFDQSIGSVDSDDSSSSLGTSIGVSSLSHPSPPTKPKRLTKLISKGKSQGRKRRESLVGRRPDLRSLRPLDRAGSELSLPSGLSAQARRTSTKPSKLAAFFGEVPVSSLPKYTAPDDMLTITVFVDHQGVQTKWKFPCAQLRSFWTLKTLLFDRYQCQDAYDPRYIRLSVWNVENNDCLITPRDETTLGSYAILVNLTWSQLVVRATLASMKSVDKKGSKMFRRKSSWSAAVPSVQHSFVLSDNPRQCFATYMDRIRLFVRTPHGVPILPVSANGWSVSLEKIDTATDSAVAPQHSATHHGNVRIAYDGLPGELCLEFVPPEVGRYLVRVEMFGEAVCNSPVMLEVEDAAQLDGRAATSDLSDDERLKLASLLLARARSADPTRHECVFDTLSTGALLSLLESSRTQCLVLDALDTMLQFHHERRRMLERCRLVLVKFLLIEYLAAVCARANLAEYAFSVVRGLMRTAEPQRLLSCVNFDTLIAMTQAPHAQAQETGWRALACISSNLDWRLRLGSANLSRLLDSVVSLFQGVRQHTGGGAGNAGSAVSSSSNASSASFASSSSSSATGSGCSGVPASLSNAGANVSASGVTSTTSGSGLLMSTASNAAAVASSCSSTTASTSATAASSSAQASSLLAPAQRQRQGSLLSPAASSFPSVDSVAARNTFRSLAVEILINLSASPSPVLIYEKVEPDSLSVLFQVLFLPSYASQLQLRILALMHNLVLTHTALTMQPFRELLLSADAYTSLLRLLLNAGTPLTYEEHEWCFLLPQLDQRQATVQMSPATDSDYEQAAEPTEEVLVSLLKFCQVVLRRDLADVRRGGSHLCSPVRSCTSNSELPAAVLAQDYLLANQMLCDVVVLKHLASLLAACNRVLRHEALSTLLALSEFLMLPKVNLSRENFLFFSSTLASVSQLLSRTTLEAEVHSCAKILSHCTTVQEVFYRQHVDEKGIQNLCKLVLESALEHHVVCGLKALCLLSTVERFRESINRFGGVPLVEAALEHDLLEAFHFHRDIRYHVMRICDGLGSGVSARVWRASYRGTDVAVKRFSADSIGFDEAAFRLEVALTSVMQHPRIVCALGAQMASSDLFIVFPLFSRGSVCQLLHNNAAADPVPLQVRARWIQQTAQAVQYLHRVGIIHRDIKPQNILIDSDWNAALCDFGTACFKPKQESRRMTMAVGSNLYIAPENLGGSSYDERVDTYSLGVTMYEIYYVCRPFEHIPILNLYQRVAVCGYRPDLYDSATNPMDQLIHTCWQGDRDLRPTMDFVCEQLEQLLSKPDLIVDPPRPEKLPIEDVLDQHCAPSKHNATIRFNRDLSPPEQAPVSSRRKNSKKKARSLSSESRDDTRRNHNQTSDGASDDEISDMDRLVLSDPEDDPVSRGERENVF